MNRANTSTHPFSELTPDVILAAMDEMGILTDGRLLALNSYENRVYQVGREDATPIIAKFYRPNRWSDESILEEHAFSRELADAELPVIPPLVFGDRTLFTFGAFRFALFERHGGHAPELDRDDHLEWLGRFMARIHNIGASRPFTQRPTLTADTVFENIAFLDDNQWLPDYLRGNFFQTANQLAQDIARVLNETPVTRLRLHGDCHPGNILWTDAGPHYVDLDDCLAGPAMQDLWMLLSGERAEREQQLWTLLEGYEEFRDFDAREIRLIEPLRGWRMINYMSWLARRWDDPAFPATFTWFNTPNYWETQLNDLRLQQEALAEPPLRRHPWQ